MEGEGTDMRLTPGIEDPWMVRVTRSVATGAATGAVERWTAVDLDEDDTTPGVYPWLAEQGLMARDAATGSWLVARGRIEARNDVDARDAVRIAYDAALAFAGSGPSPDAPGSATALDRPGLVTLEVGDDRWTFAADAVPAGVQGVIDALHGVEVAA